MPPRNWFPVDVKINDMIKTEVIKEFESQFFFGGNGVPSQIFEMLKTALTTPLHLLSNNDAIIRALARNGLKYSTYNKVTRKLIAFANPLNNISFLTFHQDLSMEERWMLLGMCMSFNWPQPNSREEWYQRAVVKAIEKAADMEGGVVERYYQPSGRYVQQSGRKLVSKIQKRQHSAAKAARTKKR